jgi:hypothetical protein
MAFFQISRKFSLKTWKRLLNTNTSKSHIYRRFLLMKKAKLMLGLVASLAMVDVGVAAGANASKGVEAATTDTVVIRGLIGGVDYWSNNYATLTYNTNKEAYNQMLVAKDP